MAVPIPLEVDELQWISGTVEAGRRARSGRKLRRWLVGWRKQREFVADTEASRSNEGETAGTGQG